MTSWKPTSLSCISSEGVARSRRMPGGAHEIANHADIGVQRFRRGAPRAPERHLSRGLGSR